MYKCPHCGETFAAISKLGLIPTHDFPKPCRSVCPGSHQNPRDAESDNRPLWKDQSKDVDTLNELLGLSSEYLPEGFQIVITINPKEPDISLLGTEGEYIEVCDDDLTTEEMVFARVNEARQLSGMVPLNFGALCEHGVPQYAKCSMCEKSD